ncbi:MAG: hypothetical protein J7485_09365 [Sphingobium sp.]|nr:hypothetical protein [Sphingobium sp.]
MRLLSATAAIAFVFTASSSPAQADDPHAGHHPEGTAPARQAKPATPPSDKTCLMMDQMKGGMSGSTMHGNMSGRSEQDMKAMQEMMKKCMNAQGKGGDGTDQHQH